MRGASVIAFTFAIAEFFEYLPAFLRLRVGVVLIAALLGARLFVTATVHVGATLMIVRGVTTPGIGRAWILAGLLYHATYDEFLLVLDHRP